jgi:dTDP-4-dehydrorhamnose reductase
MTKHTIMLLGAGGQVGQSLLAETLPAALTLRAYSRTECDITNHRAVQTAINDCVPDLIINAAAMTAVDACEKEPQKAVAANFEGPANLAAQCASRDIPLIHISTDYVFDGRDGNIPYKPTDKMNPLSVYGNTKMMGEESVRHELAWHVILRISSVFSAFSQNILTKTLDMIDKHDSLKFVNDQISCPTYAPDVAKALIAISTAILTGRADGFGTFHLCGSPVTTRYDFAGAVMAAYAPHTTRRPAITTAQSSDFPGLATRPAYSALDCESLERVYGITQNPWQDRLLQAMDKLLSLRKQVS